MDVFVALQHFFLDPELFALRILACAVDGGLNRRYAKTQEGMQKWNR